MDRTPVYGTIRNSGVIAILRGQDLDALARLSDALIAGGIRAVEVALNTPGGLEMIEWLAQHRGKELAVGAGTVLDSETARAAMLAGASFVLTPTLNPKTFEICHRYSVPIIAGAMTPTEILNAWEMGATAVKVFPAGRLGPGYLSDLRGPLPQIELIPVGGVTLENAAQFIKAGAVALGVGSELMDRKMIEAGDMDGLARRAGSFVAAVREARGGSGGA